MSEGHLFRAIVRGLMKDQFLYSEEFVGFLRPAYEGPAGEEAVRSIAGIYDALPQHARESLRDRLLRKEHLRYRFTSEGIKAIVGFYLLGVEQHNVVITETFVGTLVQHLLLLKPAKTFHFSGMGLPGVGKSTALIAIVLLIVFGKVGGGRNKALARLLESQKNCMRNLPPAIREMVGRGETKNNIYIHCDPGTMSATSLQKAVKEQKPDVKLERGDADLEEVVCGIFIDEADLIGSIKPKSKKDALVAQLSDLSEGNLTSAKWHSTDNNRTHHIKIIGWIGNISPLNPQDPDQMRQRQSVVGQMEGMLSGKFTPERLFSALNTIILK
jgi:hypothetical protein